MQKILVHKDLWQMKHFFDLALVDKETEEAYQKQFIRIPAQNILNFKDGLASIALLSD